MRFYADLHLHSRYSRATSRDCDLLQLAQWGRRKGLTVLGCGDITHPGWRAELQAQLVEVEPGLYALRRELDRPVDDLAGAAAAAPLRFVVAGEVATLFRRDGRGRKVHQLVLLPDLASAARLAARLERHGKLAADGRPMLKLDARDLLELVLETSADGLVIPAHIWTPWYSVLGSRSGFDSVEECYLDLAPQIVALETGLSADPPMIGRLRALDRFTLISCSDAHTPSRLGREATLFDCALDYFAIRRALQGDGGVVGTVEFFPEEGKYHLDGHRACGVVLHPDETRRHAGRCPACGRPLTIGVLHRVEALADRAADATDLPARACWHLVSLAELLAELLQVGAASLQVQRHQRALRAALGPELWLLQQAPLDAVAHHGPPGLDEALARLRRGAVRLQAGYDGQYGRVRLFDDGELAPRRVAGKRRATTG